MSHADPPTYNVCVNNQSDTQLARDKPLHWSPKGLKVPTSLTASPRASTNNHPQALHGSTPHRDTTGTQSHEQCVSTVATLKHTVQANSFIAAVSGCLNKHTPAHCTTPLSKGKHSKPQQPASSRPPSYDELVCCHQGLSYLAVPAEGLPG
jgi:hypothetical protein